MRINNSSFGNQYSFGETGKNNLNNHQSQEPLLFTDSFDFSRDPVNLTITKEGLESYRANQSQSMTLQPGDDIEWLRQNFHKILQGNLESVLNCNFSEKIKELNNGVAKGYENITGRMDDFLKAYTAIYDEIVRGYEEGTREFLIPNGDGSFRQITKEEELAALDKVAEKSAYFMDSGIKNGISWAKIVTEMDEVQMRHGKQIKEKTEREKAYTALLKYEKEFLEKDICGELLSAIDMIKNNYSVFKKDLGGLIDKTFKEKITINIE